MAKKSTALVQKARKEELELLLNSPKFHEALAQVMPEALTPNKFVRVLLNSLHDNPKLVMCSRSSLMLSVFQAAQLGLEVGGPLGQCWLVPYENKKKGVFEAECQLGYRGLITLAHRSGRVSKVWSEIRYEKDEWDIDLGTGRYIKHKPALDETDRGKKVGVYAVVQYADGQTDFEYMTAKAVNAIRRRAKTDKVWTSDEEEMWRKSPIKRLSKRMPLSAEDSRFLFAARMDEMQAVGEPVKELMPGTHLQIGEFMGEEEVKPEGKVVMESDAETGEAPADIKEAEPGEKAEKESAGAPQPNQVLVTMPNSKAGLAPVQIRGDIPDDLVDWDGMNWHPMKGGGYEGPQSWLSQIKEACGERGIEWREE